MFKIRTVLIACIMGILFFTSCNKTEKPNIILIITDDMGYSDIGCYGGDIQTPNLDKLGAEGLCFSRFYNCGKCEPSRATITSGHYYHTTNKAQWKKNLPSFGDLMKEAGYSTMSLGKWHVYGNPWERGFDRCFGHLSGATDFFRGDKTFFLDGEKWQVPSEGFYNTDANTDFAIKFIKEEKEKNPDKPFFMYLAYNAPHGPIQAIPEDVKKYRGKYLKGWDSIRAERFARQKALGLMKPEWNMSPRPDAIQAWDSLSDKEKDMEDLRMAVYAAMVDRVDQGVGRIVSELEEMGLRDNTIIMFVNDNGGNPFDRHRGNGKPINQPGASWNVGLGWANCSNTPFKFYKRTQHNGGNMTPFIVNWPGKVQHIEGYVDNSCHLIDIVPTLLDLAGGSYPDMFNNEKTPALPGKSMLSLFEGEQKEIHDTLYFSLFRNRAVVVGDWKLVTAYDQPWELFNLETDRAETNNLIESEPEKAKQLLKIWNDWTESESVGIAKTNKAEPVRQPLFDAEGNLLPPQPEPKAVPLEQ